MNGVLTNDAVRGSLAQAWRDSQPATPDAHEEGGFVLRNPDGTLAVERWPRGTQRRIIVPAHAGGFRGGRPIIATFHTHPNPPPAFQQEPSPADVRAVRQNPDLGHPDYEGEFVIAAALTYRIRWGGQVEVVGDTNALLGLS